MAGLRFECLRDSSSVDRGTFYVFGTRFERFRARNEILFVRFN